MPDPKYSDSFLKAIAFILPHETEYARGHWNDDRFVVTENVSGDAGGLTKYGIDARSHPGVDIKNLTRAQAIAIYWEEWKWRNVDAVPERLAVALFDVWVNGGFPVKWLQRAINLSNTFRHGRDLVVDGDLGPKTVAAAQMCDQASVLRYFINERDDRFQALVTSDPQFKKFLAGWEARDTDLRKFLAA